MEPNPAPTDHGRYDADDLLGALGSRGFTVRRVLPRPVALELARALTAIAPPPSGPMSFANVTEDRWFMGQVNELTAPLWDRYLRPHLPGHRVVFSTCVVKYPHDHSHMDAHEDGTYVDERHHRAVTMWMSLVDCTPEHRNGMIQVLPGSHLVAGTAAGANVHEWHRPYRSYLTDHLTPVPTIAGDAVFWDSRLIHGSPPNRSDQPRLAVAAVLVPADAQLLHVDALGRTARRAFAVDDRFFLDHSPIAVRHVMPSYPELRRFTEPETLVDGATIAALCGNHEPPVPDAAPRPTDDWFPEGDPGDGTVAPTGGDHTAIDRLCEQVVEVVRGGPVPTVDVTALAGLDVDRVSGEVTGCTLVTNGRRAADLVPALAAADLAGDPRVRSAHLLFLAPGSAVAPNRRAGATTVEVHIPLVTPGGNAGLATPVESFPAELGHAVRTPADAPRQIWNDSGEILPWLIVETAADINPPRRHRLRWGRRARSSSRTRT